MTSYYNKTRTSKSIPRKLVKERKLHLVPIYYLLRTSRLAQEGIENSGSYYFADHIYAGQPAGRYLIGRVLDTMLLKLPAARSFRYRYLYAKEEIRRHIDVSATKDLQILAVPSGLARELFEVSDELRQQKHPAADSVTWHGIDLDQDLIRRQTAKAAEGRHRMYFHHGDAFHRDSYPGQSDMIISLGFSEFLSDQQVVDFYHLVYVRLKTGGVFYTSATERHRLSDYLMRNFAELKTNYRTAADLSALALAAGFKRHKTYLDPVGLQSMLVAVKE